MTKDFKISVLVSGNGTNLQALIDGISTGALLGVEIAQVISNRKDAYGLKRAEIAKIPGYLIEKGLGGILMEENESLFKILELEKPDLIVLAGYLRKIEDPVLSAYKNRIINIHPALLPKYGGPGFYGLKVHEAVIRAGEKESGATVHYVDEELDTGRIILQEKVAVDTSDTPEALAKKVLVLEHRLIVEAVNIIANRK